LGSFQIDCGFKGIHSHGFISFGIQSKVSNQVLFYLLFLAYLIHSRASLF